MARGALSDDEVETLLAPLTSFGCAILAVSGGPDSTALLYLAARWSRRCEGRSPRLVSVTVDHGLRATSADEAAQVARLAQRLGIEHRAVQWAGPRPVSGVQAAARRARYAILCDAASELATEGADTGDVAIVTAHTADDQAETLLMRLARGSGVDGLAAILPVRRIRHPLDPERGPFILLRPLLGVPHARLVASAGAAGLAYVDDPSNADTQFERVRVRGALRALEGLGFSTEALGRTAARMQHVKEALDVATDDLERRALTLRAGLVHELDRDILSAAPLEIAVRLLRRVLSRTGGIAPPAELGAIEDAVERSRLAAAPRAFTLGGSIVERMDSARARKLCVYREPDRDGGLPTILLRPGDVATWDGRFRASVGTGHPAVVELGPLGADWSALVATHPGLSSLKLPAAAGRGLPAFRQAGQVVAVPSLADACRKKGWIAVASVLAGPLQGETGGGLTGGQPSLNLTVLEPPPAALEEG